MLTILILRNLTNECNNLPYKKCMKCKLTAHLLNMNTKMVLIDPINKPNDPIIQYMRRNNMKSAPLVRIYDDDKLIDEWE